MAYHINRRQQHKSSKSKELTIDPSRMKVAIILAALVGLTVAHYGGYYGDDDYYRGGFIGFGGIGGYGYGGLGGYYGGGYGGYGGYGRGYGGYGYGWGWKRPYWRRYRPHWGWKSYYPKKGYY